MPDVALLRWENLPGRVGEVKARQEVQRITSGIGRRNLQPAAVGFGEGGHLGRRGILDDIDGYVPEVMQQHTPLPILVHEDVEVTGHMDRRAYGATKVGPWGAGPATMSPGWNQAVLLEPEGVEPFWFLVGHLVPSINRKANGKVAQASREARRALHRLEVEQIADMAAGVDRFVAVADWNCRPSDPAVAPMWAAGLTSAASSKPTHTAGGVIDWFAVKGVEVERVRRMSRGPSDHWPIELVIR